MIYAKRILKRPTNNTHSVSETNMVAWPSIHTHTKLLVLFGGYTRTKKGTIMVGQVFLKILRLWLQSGSKLWQ